MAANAVPVLAIRTTLTKEALTADESAPAALLPQVTTVPAVVMAAKAPVFAQTLAIPDATEAPGPAPPQHASPQEITLPSDLSAAKADEVDAIETTPLVNDAQTV
jgi:hypothetical protein